MIGMPVRVEAGIDVRYARTVELILDLFWRVDKDIGAMDEQAGPGTAVGDTLLARLDANAAGASGLGGCDSPSRPQEFYLHMFPLITDPML
jgi:hypothetical protein